MDDRVEEALAASGDPEAARHRLEAVLAADPGLADDPVRLARVARVCGASRALASALAVHPSLIDGETPPSASVPLRLRAALIPILADDLEGVIDLRTATARWSDAVDVITREVLEEARQALLPQHPALEETALAVIAMGKWGARELNYYSDLDMVFAHEGPDGSSDPARAAAIALASRVMTTLSSPTFEGTAFVVDATLRPEGAIGPLSRSLSSHRSYYDRWAEGWELQALLKARAAAGAAEVGKRFVEMAHELVWERGLEPEELRAIRLIKARSEGEAAPRDLKRGPGGIRDIEFAVQMLQMVHGRFDPDLRKPATLDGIDELGANGYIAADEAERLADAYRFLRQVEHRLQIWDLTQTHSLPASLEERERLGRSLGWIADPVGEFDRRLTEVRATARDLHERLYFRPILESLAGIPSARLEPEAARMRLAALGFRELAAAEAAFADMTAGLSRRSRAMQQALPLTLDWLSRSPDPDLGLRQLRLLLAHTTDHGALATLIHTNPVAGERLCLLLGTGELLGALLDRIPEFATTQLSADEPDWNIRDRAGAIDRLIGLLDSRPDPDEKVGTIRRFARRRTLRIAARDIIDGAPPEVTTGSLSDTGDAVITGALHALGAEKGFGVLAMGKWGGRELSYGSDLDLVYVHADDGDEAVALAGEVERMVSAPSRHGPGLVIDTELRPEGRRGPLTRSLEGYRRYYAEWAEPWEVLALVRARPAAGDPDLLDAFMEMVEPVVWRPELDEAFVRSIRMVKARVETERLPVGVEPAHHLKLGPGGLSDIEFVTQLLQLRHGATEPAVRTPNTREAIRALGGMGALASDEAGALEEALELLTRLRLRLHLRGGRSNDIMPTNADELGRLAAALGFDRRTELMEQYRRHTRRARRVFEKRFFDT
ncbi:MAG TPA: bifunctional [glutamine synthetase] adenylyltransferase/[glutamine synthetase]-adenylyl-L-tyrosine phosphorylase [Acidimicrobiia bacterium]